MKISAIVAVSENGVIGIDGVIPWQAIPEDMRQFRELTTGHVVIMGRKTWESLPVKPLPNRINYVLSKSVPLASPWSIKYEHRRGLLSAFGDCEFYDWDAFVIGGEQLYREALPHCDEVYLTRVHCNVAIPAGAEVARFNDDWLFDQDFNCEILGRSADGIATFYRYFRGSVKVS